MRRMPPKKAPPQGASKKTEAKKKEKVIEVSGGWWGLFEGRDVVVNLNVNVLQDKTFGLKNKKGGKQQKFIQQVQKQVHSGGNPLSRKAEAEKEALKLAKKVGEDELLGDIFKPVQKVEKGEFFLSFVCSWG